MSGKLKRGWALARASFSVLRLHPKLAVLPTITGLLFLTVVGVIVMSMWPKFGSFGQAMDWFEAWHKSGAYKTVGFYAAAFGVIFAMSVVAIFLNVATIHASLRALAGDKPSIRAGLAAAAGLIPQIVGWALLTTTVGLVLNAVHDYLKAYLGFLGSLLGGLLEVSWAAVTYFVVPVLAAEKVGPVAAVKRSASILRSKWGESLTGEAALSLLGMLFAMLAMMVAFVGIAVAAMFGTAAMAVLGAILIALGIFAFIAIAVTMQTLSSIFQSGVYLYATTGQVPATFNADLMEGAFRRKA